MKILIDREICIGASACVANAGKSFALDETGKAKPQTPPGNSDEEIRQAAWACPTGAITLLEETSAAAE